MRRKLESLPPARRRLRTMSKELALQPYPFPWMIVLIILGIMAISVYGVGFMTESAPTKKGQQPILANTVPESPEPTTSKTLLVETTAKPTGEPFCAVGQLVNIMDFRQPRYGQERNVPERYRELVATLPQVEVYYRDLDYRETVFMHSADSVLLGPKLVEARKSEQPMCLIVDAGKKNQIGVFLKPQYR